MRVLVTGANRGIGAALVAELNSRGHRVTGTARQASGGLWPLDVTRAADHAALAAMVEAEGGELGLLVCNAGVYLDNDDAPMPLTAQVWADSFAVNVTGVFLTIQALLPAIRRAGGKIAIIGSQMGSSTRANGGSYVYRATKAAVLNLGRNLATDLAPQGIAVGIYHPGWVRTEMGGSGADIDAATSARGLAHRFERLGPATSGVFETWDGRPMPF